MRILRGCLVVAFFAGAASAISVGAAWLYLTALGLTLWVIERYIRTGTQ